MWYFALILLGAQLCLGLPRQQRQEDVEVLDSTRVNCKVTAVVTYPSTTEEALPTVECTNKCTFKTENKDQIYFVGYVYRHFDRLEKEYGLMLQIRYNRGANADKSCVLVPATDDEEVLSTHIEGNSPCDMKTLPSTTLPTTLPSTTLPTTLPPTTVPTTLPHHTEPWTTVPTTVPVTHDFFTTFGTTLPPTTISTTLPYHTAPSTVPTTIPITQDPIPTTLPTTLPPTTISTTIPITHDPIPTTLPTTLPPTTISTTMPITHDLPTTLPSTLPSTTISTTLPYHTEPSTVPTTIPITHDPITTTLPTTLPPTTISTTMSITHDLPTTLPSTTISTTMPICDTIPASTATLPSTTTPTIVTTTDHFVTTTMTTTLPPTTTTEPTTTTTSTTTTTTEPTTTTTSTSTTTTLATTTSWVCGSDWVLIGTACFHLSEVRGDWSEGRDYCAGLGATLASIRTQEEQDGLAGLIDDNAWIGLHDMHSEGAHLWEDQTALSYSNWEPGQPDNSGTFLWWGSGEDCVEMNLGYSLRWNDQDCDNENIYICRRDAELQG